MPAPPEGSEPAMERAIAVTRQACMRTRRAQPERAAEARTLCQQLAAGARSSPCKPPMRTLKPIFRPFSLAGAARLWLFAAVALSACGSKAAPKPMPVAKVIVPAAAPAQPSPEPEPPPMVIHTLAVGETLWDVARAYGVSTK